MSTEAVVTQRDRAREAEHERRRAGEERRRREAWEARRAEEQLAAEARRLERLAEAADRAADREALLLRRAEAELIRLSQGMAAAETPEAPVAAPDLKRVAMAWQDMEEITRIAKEFGYVAVGPGSLANGEEEWAVTMLLEHPEHPPVGLVLEPEGLLVLSADPTVEANFVDPIARARAVRRLAEYFESRGGRLEIRECPDGAVELVGLFAPSPQPSGVRVTVRDTGDAVVRVEGVRGRGCQDVAQAVAGAMDGSVIESCPTPDYYLPPVAPGQERVSHGG